MTVRYKEFNPPLINPSRIGIDWRSKFGNRVLKPGVHNLDTDQMAVSVSVRKDPDKQIRGVISLSSKVGGTIILVEQDTLEATSHRYTSQYKLNEASEDFTISDDKEGKRYVYGVLWFQPD